MQIVTLYLTTLIIGLVIDGIWLSVVAKNFYTTNIGHLMAASPNWLAAGLFYLLYVCGVLYFVVYPSLQNNFSLTRVLIAGALFGLVAYGTYDLTNQATLKNWPWLVTFVDLAWGAFFTAAISLLTVWLAKWFN